MSFGLSHTDSVKNELLICGLAFLSLSLSLSLFHLSLQEVKRAVVGFFTSNDTTAYMSFAKVSHMLIMIIMTYHSLVFEGHVITLTSAGCHQSQRRLSFLCCTWVSNSSLGLEATYCKCRNNYDFSLSWPTLVKMVSRKSSSRMKGCVYTHSLLKSAFSIQ